jgi:hypothetical protein
MQPPELRRYLEADDPTTLHRQPIAERRGIAMRAAGVVATNAGSSSA